MSDIDKDDMKREYLPLVNHNSEGADMRVNNRSVLSVEDRNGSSQHQPLVEARMNEQTFYQKNKKVINIGLIVLLVVGVILAIVLPLTLGGHGGDDPYNPNPPEPEPTEPDPFQYQEFNPFYADPDHPPQVTTFEANFRLFFNNSAINQNNTEPTSLKQQALNRLPKSLWNFLGLKDVEPAKKADKPLDGFAYRPMNPRYVVNSTNNTWASSININVQMNNNNQAKVVISNPKLSANTTARQLPNQNLFQRPPLEIEARLQQAGFKSNLTSSFAMNFTDIYSEETLISTMYRKLVVTDFYQEVGFVLPTQRCFGLGQRNGKFQLQMGTYSYNVRHRDDSLPLDDGLGGKSGNHIQPFLLCQTETRKDFFGMFFASTAPQVFEVVKYTNSTKMVVNYITVGGALEFYVFLRGTAQEIVQRYHNLVGTPMMPPYYALGVFHGSNAYSKWADIRKVYDNYNGAVGPKQALEGVFVETFNQLPHWSLTVDTFNYPNLGAEVDKIRAGNQRVLFGASVALATDPAYPWYTQAKQAQCLVKSHPATALGPLTGVLDQVEVQYLDSFSGCFDSWMGTALSAFNLTVHGLDGLLLKDAHSPNHVNGQIVLPAAGVAEIIEHGRKLQQEEPNVTKAYNEEQIGYYQPYKINNQSQQWDLSTYNLPFIPAFDYSGALDNLTISLNGTLGDDLGGGRYSTLQVRNGMAGFALKRTANVVDSIKQNLSRTLLFSEASWAGSGSYSVGLLTGQYRSWDDLQNLIPQAVAMSMYGLSPMVDTCGSLGPMDEQVCSKWTQLATFMPMVRNYYNATYRDAATGQRTQAQGSEPWNAQSDQLNLAYASLGDRLKLSRYIYTQMYLAHTQGGSVIKPLFFDFPKDDEVFSDSVQRSTFLLGSAIKVTPDLSKKADGQSFDAYFPQGLWVNLYQPSQIINVPAGGQNVSLDVSFAQTNIHQKAGTIIPWLNNDQSLRTTRDIETTLRTGFRIVRDPVTNYAEGDFMLDDGETPNPYSPAYMDTYAHDQFDKNFTHYGLRYSSQKTINFQVQHGDSSYQPAADRAYRLLDKIEIMNAQDLKDTDFACALDASWRPTNLTVFYSESNQILTIKPNATVDSDITFDQAVLIKFGNSQKDVSFCNGFTYNATFEADYQAETVVIYNLTSGQAKGVLPELVAVFTLLDDEGSVQVQITTEADYEANGALIYKPPQPEFYDIAAFQKGKKLTKKVHDFVQIEEIGFTYQILNAAGEVIYESDPKRLMVMDYFVIDAGEFRTNNYTGHPLMGLGERAGRAQLKNQKNSVHTLWPYDAPNPIDDGKAPGKNMYGYQPIYYYQAHTADWLAVFDVGTYAVDYFVNTDVDGQGQGQTRVTRVAAGGLVHKIFIQAKPKSSIETVIKKYQTLTGYQSVPPMWAFGWNQCKFGYYNQSIWWDVYQNYSTFNLPLDTMWADIDYMDDYKVFTISEQTYPDLPAKVQQIKKDGRFFVPIIDDAIAVRPNQNYAPYESGLQKDVFIKKADLSGPATGGVWPGNAYYPDFFKPETVTWWQDNLKTLNNELAFDGIWLDMNEASSTCVGYCYQDERPQMAMKYSFPYIPGQRDLEVQALGLDTVHTTLKDPNGKYRTEHDVRSLYAIKESQATFDYLKQGGKRPFVLSRSNAPGLQKYAFHWLADNWSKVEWMKTSIDSLYEYNLFGLPMMGSDICGFNLNASPELCTRWHQLGSFYPFSRNHKNSVWKQTEPFQYNFTVPDLDDGRTYTDLIRTALLQRYSLLRYIYSSFHQIGQQGGAFFKPLYYDYPNDNSTYDDDSTERNILLGSALKLSIQVQDLDQVSTVYQFPADRWCQILPTIDPSKCWDTSAGAETEQRLDSGIADYQVHLRGGRLIPYQNATALKANKSADLMNAKTELLVLTNPLPSPIEIAPYTYNAIAAGSVFLDDGTSATDISRVDIEVTPQGHGQYFITFHTITDLKNEGAAGLASTLSQIRFLWGSNTGQSIKSAQLIERSGAQVELYAPQYEPVQDVLIVLLENSQAGKTWNFWSIDKIILNSN